MAIAEPARTRGRPRLTTAGAQSTRDRLMAAAAAVCVERGYEGATVGEIARRAGVTTGAIYNHFGGRSELLVEAARQTLAAVGGERHLDVDTVVRRFLAPGFADTRRFLLELHGASLRHPDLAQLLGSWHAERAAELEAAGADRADVKALFLVLLGCCQLEALVTIGVSLRRVEASMSAAAAGLGLDETT
ncbi:MAG: TetR/AcrR family transcriptional regulator [Ilumatobacteraceae bacterium]